MNAYGLPSEMMRSMVSSQLQRAPTLVPGMHGTARVINDLGDDTYTLAIGGAGVKVKSEVALTPGQDLRFSVVEGENGIALKLEAGQVSRPPNNTAATQAPSNGDQVQVSRDISLRLPIESLLPVATQATETEGGALPVQLSAHSVEFQLRDGQQATATVPDASSQQPAPRPTDASAPVVATPPDQPASAQPATPVDNSAQVAASEVADAPVAQPTAAQVTPTAQTPPPDGPVAQPEPSVAQPTVSAEVPAQPAAPSVEPASAAPSAPPVNVETPAQANAPAQPAAPSVEPASAAPSAPPVNVETPAQANAPAQPAAAEPTQAPVVAPQAESLPPTPTVNAVAVPVTTSANQSDAQPIPLQEGEATPVQNPTSSPEQATSAQSVNSSDASASNTASEAVDVATPQSVPPQTTPPAQAARPEVAAAQPDPTVPQPTATNGNPTQATPPPPAQEAVPSSQTVQVPPTPAPAQHIASQTPQPDATPTTPSDSSPPPVNSDHVTVLPSNTASLAENVQAATTSIPSASTVPPSTSVPITAVDVQLNPSQPVNTEPVQAPAVQSGVLFSLDTTTLPVQVEVPITGQTLNAQLSLTPTQVVALLPESLAAGEALTAQVVDAVPGGMVSLRIGSSIVQMALPDGASLAIGDKLTISPQSEAMIEGRIQVNPRTNAMDLAGQDLRFDPQIQRAGLTPSHATRQAAVALAQAKVPIERQHVQSLLAMAAGRSDQARGQMLSAAAKLIALDAPVSLPIAAGMELNQGVGQPSVSQQLGNATTALGDALQQTAPEMTMPLQDALKSLQAVSVLVDSADTPAALSGFVNTFGRESLAHAAQQIEQTATNLLEQSPQLRTLNAAIERVLDTVHMREVSGPQSAGSLSSTETAVANALSEPALPLPGANGPLSKEWTLPQSAEKALTDIARVEQILREVAAAKTPEEAARVIDHLAREGDRRTLEEVGHRLQEMEREALARDPVLQRLSESASEVRDLGRRFLAMKAQNLAAMRQDQGMFIADVPIRHQDESNDTHLQMFYRKGGKRGPKSWDQRVVLDLDMTALGPVVGDMRFTGKALALNLFGFDQDAVDHLSEDTTSLIDALHMKGFTCQPAIGLMQERHMSENSGPAESQNEATPDPTSSNRIDMKA